MSHPDFVPSHANVFYERSDLQVSSTSLSAALQQLRRHDYSALDLAEACLRQLEQLNPLINAFILPTPELAVQAAMQADVLLSRPSSSLDGMALLGIPLGVKDMFNLAGLPTRAGSKFFAEDVPAEDAQAVLNLKLSGGVVLGKTATHEIALGVTGVNPHYGAVKNPWDLARISGGSSSGSAAAVSSGMCLAAIGTDTGGSIRIPASLCGVVGLKPTYGRVSTRGVLPLSWNLDHIGPLTRTVRDAAQMLAVLAGFDAHDPACANIPVDDYLAHLQDGVLGWRVALAFGEYIQAADVSVLAALDAAAGVFQDLGAQVEQVDMSWLADLALANGQMTQSDAAAFHRRHLAEHPDWFGEDVLQRLRSGAALTSAEYALARRTQTGARRRFEMFFEKFDLLLLPTTPVPAPLIKDTIPMDAARSLTRFTSPFNLSGVPALTLPCGFTQAGLPLGLQLVSKHWAESTLLQAGYAFEQATEWHTHKPSISTLP